MRQAFYTEPVDQSGWLYHRWLLSRVTGDIPTLPALLIALGHNDMDSSSSNSSSEVEGSESAEQSSSDVRLDPLTLFDRELVMCRQLDDIEPNCKWILLTTALLLAGRQAINRQQTQQPRDTVDVSASVMEESVVAELGSLFGRLILLDPMRTNYYRDVHASFTNRREAMHTATATATIV